MIVLVDLSGRLPREVARYAYAAESTADVQRLTVAYSQNGRTVRAYGADRHWKHWHKQSPTDALFEAHDGQPTEAFR